MKLTTARFIAILLSLFCCSTANPQGRPIDWPSAAGDAQRTGWEKVDTRITKNNVKEFQLVLKRKLENPRAPQALLAPPIVLGLLISYRGFKELAFVADSANDMWAIDTDMDRIFWQRHFDSSAPSGSCDSVSVTIPALIPPVNFGARPRPGAARAAGTAAGAPPARPTRGGVLGAGGFGAPRPLFGVSADGKLHLMNTSTGDDFVPAIAFLPANEKASSLTVSGGVVYATTNGDCNHGAGSVWSIDLNEQEPKAVSYPLKSGVSRHDGFALGNDGTVYVQTGGNSPALLALSAKDLKPKQTFIAPAGGHPAPHDLNVITPVVFAYQGRDVVATAGADGSLYLLDSKSLGGDDQKTPLYRTPPLSADAQSGGIWGGLATWLDGETRWVLAPVWGGLNSDLHVPTTNGTAANGAIVAFKVEDRDGKPVLTPAWASRNLESPQPPVMTGGLVFALSSGTHATLYALDATTGNEVYSTGDQVPSPASFTGVTLANGRVFFTTTDRTLYGFGLYLER